jgi:hypothetical protein
MNKADKGTQRARRLAQFLNLISRVPGMGFLRPYAAQIDMAAAKVVQVRGSVANQMDDVGDARDAWDNFKDNR